MLDYLVVGLGLAGISFCETLEKNDKTFVVVSDDSQKSSTVAGGLYNPVILKRFTSAWNAGEQLDFAIPFYNGLENRLGVQLDYKVPVLRRFASIEEQNMWFEASDRIVLKPFLSAKIVSNINSNIDAPFGYGEVLGTGRIDTQLLQEKYWSYLVEKKSLVHESFRFSELEQHGDYVSYQSLKARRIVFATGYGLKGNSFFNYLPLNGTKGELLTIKAPSLKEESVVKSSIFIIPLGNDLYRVGATYKWKDKTHTPTQEAKNELLEKLSVFLRCDYEVIDHVAGIRPTVVDRRPLVGRHPQYRNIYVLNGFGSRGVMIGPWASNNLYKYVETGESLPKEMDIDRFTKKYFKDQAFFPSGS
ncbi:glycine/D-amino acid oxidase-like deaminating enzyme [Saonia flava]|uniref:Glycine/D-amino acid oxidase-like deaminating enzyme n=1 Tax=Saonia flava TaxID=523696 RepID=A0A846R1W0_9FLAO|nr:FAD-dependent oxidoreductase [Saonia flava]NJB71925.1 glycine/D-amino acid oxidase-like deaminating enzyme [Saonia flava]